MSVYVPIPYPKWLYASGGRTCIVQSYEEELVKGPEWVATPALLHTVADIVPAQQAPVSPTAVVLTTAAEAVMKRFYAMPAKAVADQVATLPTLDEVREVRDMEELRPTGARKAVMAAVLARMEQLTVPENGS